MLSDLANFCDFLTKIKSSATDQWNFVEKCCQIRQISRNYLMKLPY